MKTIVIQHKSAIEIINIVHEMQRYGWVINLDFDWEYHKAESLAEPAERYAKFIFYKEEHSTYFALRWL
jgi:hypothetical protein